MRLPQSSRRLLSLFSIITFLPFAGLMPLRAQSGSQLTSSPAQVKFGGVVVGQSEAQVVTLTNSGSSSITISAINSGGGVFQVSGPSLPAVLSAGQSADVSITFAPGADGWFGQNVTFVNNGSILLRLSVQGSGVATQALTASPATLSFGQVATGSTVTLPVVLTNQRGWTLMLTGLQALGNGFTVSGPSLPVKLTAGQKVTLNVSFTPKSTGEAGGSVSVSGVPLSIPLVGTGTTTAAGQLGESPSSLSFGNVDEGSSSTQQFALSATGAPVTISSASSSNTQFTISGVSFPLTIPASQSVQVYVTYSPTSSGAASAALTLASNASNKPSEALSGTGVAAAYSVNLAWTASTSPVSGYNIYRGTTAGTYTKINPSLNSTTSYTDNTVSSGVTYYYAATAVNSSGEESSYSSPPLQVAIP
jgi:Abnormal spindle-like microcephaly-assoc'd, ASPM-SPD-2-Hydin